MDSKHQAYAEQIIALQTTDLQLRDQLLKSGELEKGYHPVMECLHKQNAVALERIMEEIGYPTISKVGAAANDAAWLVIQHAISQPAFMRKSAALLAEAVAEKEAQAIHLAYLTDRIAVFTGAPQRYGTQFDWDEEGRLSPQPYDDAAAVNERRAALGLNTLAEQTEIMRARTAKEQGHPPYDLAQRRRAYDVWRKKVGWLD